MRGNGGFGQYSDRTAERTNPLADKPKSAKRQKQVYRSNELPHLWAHKTQPSARNAQGNFYFDGDVIYSYGSHFPVARHVTNKSGRAAVLITSRSYSVTTQGHISAVRDSIPSGVIRFSVPFVWACEGVLGQEHSRNLEHFVSESKDALSKAENARKYAASHLSNAFEQRELCRKYARFFSIKTADFSFLPKGKKLESLKAQITARRQKADVLDAARDARREARRAEHRKLEALALPEKIAAWRAGSSVYLPYNVPALLRLSKDGTEVETSKGVRVPVDHALKALGIIRAVVKSGREYVRNGRTEYIGHYTIDAITPDGTLRAGCHVIAFSEVENCAQLIT